MKMGRVRKWLVVGKEKKIVKRIAEIVVEGIVVEGIVVVNRVVVVIWHRPQKTILPTTKTPSRTN